MKSQIHNFPSKYLKMSKILFAVLAICLMSISSFAQQGINYKGIIKDDLGNVLNATFMNVQFTIHQGTTTGTIVYQENHNYTTDANGLIILNIGTDPSPNIGTFASINWSEDLHFLQTTITYNGGTINFDATEFMAVPYAKHAETAKNVTGLETIEEGSGIGWRLIGKNPDNYGPIGNGAVDLSQSPNSATNGATGEYSTAMGNQTRASGDNSTAMGFGTSASGDNSTALGRNTFASSENSLAIGWLNVDVPDALFMIGNGSTEGGFTTSNALTVLKNGNVIAGGPFTIENAADATSSWRLETRPNGGLSMYRNGNYRGYFSESTGVYSSISDRRLKRDITAIENGTLSKVMQLNPVSYLMKDQTDTNRNLGLISQEVQKIFPSITSYVEESDLITLSYTELIPILIKALQEQQNIIDAQNKTIESQTKKDIVQDKSIEALSTRLNLIESKSTN